jgi:hypothetical protein
MQALTEESVRLRRTLPLLSTQLFENSLCRFIRLKIGSETDGNRLFLSYLARNSGLAPPASLRRARNASRSDAGGRSVAGGCEFGVIFCGLAQMH